MAQQPMYPAIVNSPQTELAADIDASATSITVLNGTALPDAPNLATIGSDETAETILYTVKDGNELSGVTRGFQGTAKAWTAGAKVARMFTAYDHDTFRSNIADHENRLAAHIGSGGSAHAVATAVASGFMSAADKAKLDEATPAATASTLMQRDTSGRAKVTDPVSDDDAATKRYVDAKDANMAKTNVDNNFSAIQTFNGPIDARASIEVGLRNKSDTPYIDFHSSGNNIDYDARIIAFGGTTTVGEADLNFYAFSLKRYENIIFDAGNSPVTKSNVGYQKLANGFLLQWGTSVLSASETKTITYPIAFAANCIPQIVGVTMDYPDAVSIVDSSTSNTQFQLRNSLGGNVRFRWMAIGWV